jgi:hypothetical protein
MKFSLLREEVPKRETYKDIQSTNKKAIPILWSFRIIETYFMTHFTV